MPFTDHVLGYSFRYSILRDLFTTTNYFYYAYADEDVWFYERKTKKFPFTNKHRNKINRTWETIWDWMAFTSEITSTSHRAFAVYVCLTGNIANYDVILRTWIVTFMVNSGFEREIVTTFKGENIFKSCKYLFSKKKKNKKNCHTQKIRLF